MKMQRIIGVSLIAVIVISMTGCFPRLRRWREKQSPPPPRTYHDPVFPGARPGDRPEVLMPAPNGNSIPPLPPAGSSNYGPSGSTVDPRLPRAGTPFIPPTRTDSTEPPLAKPGKSGMILLPPDLRDPPRSGPPSVSESVDGTSGVGLPVGVPGFVEVKPQVAAGQRPDLEGLDWLKVSKYRTVIHLHAAGAVTASDRDVVERRGMRYIAIEVSPETLSSAKLDQFSQAVNSLLDAPVFVYDGNGLFNGAMFYLHFRLTDRLSDDAARKKAATLGLRDSGTAEATSLWLAIQKLVNDSK
jgi:protein tyrosine phosphatase (PTP) superfamily phosphohydrolase (DUF442 family)